MLQLQKPLSKWRQRFDKNGLKSLGFWSKAQNFVPFRSYDLVQISPACGSNTHQIMYGETVTFNDVSICNGSTGEF